MTADDTKDEQRSRPPAESEVGGASTEAATAAKEATPGSDGGETASASEAKESAAADLPAADVSGTTAGTSAGDSPAREPRIDELEAVRKERSDLAERLLRTAADFDNFRKRSRREIDEAKLRGKDDALRELLPVFDNLERAVRASGDAGDSAAIVEGVRMVLKLFEDTTQRMGLNRVPTVGERFDPAVHEAIQQQESSEHTPGTIIAEVAPGYMFGKRLLRAAMVIVARRPAEVKAADPAPANGSDAKVVNGEPPSSNAAGNKADETAGHGSETRDESRGAPDGTVSEGAPR